jgi:hypothetical protein
MSDEEVGLVCSPVDGFAEAVVPGSTTMFCNECGCEVWVAPTSQLIFDKHDEVWIVCTGCALVGMMEDRVDRIEQPLPEQLDELEAHGIDLAVVAEIFEGLNKSIRNHPSNHKENP